MKTTRVLIKRKDGSNILVNASRGVSRTMETATMVDIGKDEVRRNYEVFVKRLPELLPAHAGKFALIHSEQIVHFF